VHISEEVTETVAMIRQARTIRRCLKGKLGSGQTKIVRQVKSMLIIFFGIKGTGRPNNQFCILS
jgi:hypothetical protein